MQLEVTKITAPSVAGVAEPVACGHVLFLVTGHCRAYSRKASASERRPKQGMSREYANVILLDGHGWRKLDDGSPYRSTFRTFQSYYIQSRGQAHDASCLQSRQSIVRLWQHSCLPHVTRLVFNHVIHGGICIIHLCDKSWCMTTNVARTRSVLVVNEYMHENRENRA